MPGAFEGSKSSTFNQKKRKNLKSYASRSYEAGADLPYGHCTIANQQSMLMGKRPASLNVGSIPTKRMRTASRQRVVSPFGAGATGNVQAQIKTDASSGDTNSFQDDQSTLHGGSQFQKSMEVESVGDFEKHLPYDYAETSMKPKKKKKAKHLVHKLFIFQLDCLMLGIILKLLQLFPYLKSLVKLFVFGCRVPLMTKDGSWIHLLLMNR